MPAKTRHPVDSTLRVRQTRARRKIAKLREDKNWLVFIVRSFFEGHDVPLTRWVRADEIHDAPVTDKNIQASVFLPLDAFIQQLKDSPALETSTLRVRIEDVLIVRPRYLGVEVL